MRGTQHNSKQTVYCTATRRSYLRSRRNRIEGSSARICNHLSSPGIDSQLGGPIRQPYLTYRSARLAATTPWNRFLGSLNVYKLGLCREESRKRGEESGRGRLTTCMTNIPSSSRKSSVSWFWCSWPSRWGAIWPAPALPFTWSNR